MIDYKIVKYCRVCKKRFVVNKGESKFNYCVDCQKEYEKRMEKQAKLEKEAEEVSSK